MQTATATAQTFTLINPRAFKSAHTHRVHYTTTADGAVIVGSADCDYTSEHTMCAADARADYRQQLAAGCYIDTGKAYRRIKPGLYSNL